MDLEALRRKIDDADRRIVALLNERAAYALEIGTLKTTSNAPIKDPKREQDVLDRVAALNRGPLEAGALKRIYRAVIDECADLEVAHEQKEQAVNGFIELANPGIGALPTYEPGRPTEEVARELGLGPDADIVKLASNENALGPSRKAVDAMCRAASGMHRYPDGGAFYLKRALAQKLDVSADAILPGNGSNELLEFLAHVFLGPGTGIVMAEYAFVVYRLIAAAARAEVVAVPMKDLTHDLEAMLDAIGPDTRLVFVSNPNNPTGTMVGQQDIERFMEQVPGHVVVCFDEAYVELLPPERQPDTVRYVREGRQVVVLRTFSKTYGLAGLRLGYAIAPPECIGLLSRVRQPFNVNAMAQEAAVAALRDGEHVAATRRLVAEELAFLQDGFSAMELAYVPSCANFVLVQVGEGRAVFEQLQKAGIIVRPMDGYALPDYVRVTIGTRPENERCLEALRAVLAERTR